MHDSAVQNASLFRRSCAGSQTEESRLSDHYKCASHPPWALLDHVGPFSELRTSCDPCWGALEAPTAAPTLLPGLPPMTAHPVGDLLGSAACCGQHHHLLEVICWAAPHVEPFDKLLSSTPRAKSGTGGCPTPTLTLQPRRCCPSLYSPPLISLSPHPLAAPLCRASIQLERNSSDCSSGSSSSSSSRDTVAAASVAG
eukprot:1156931-Pelagomonas_calceolata.AAC.6